MFVSPPPGVEWSQGADPTTQTSVEIEGEDVDWAELRAREEAAAKAAGKRPAAPKQSKKRLVTTLLTGGALNINEPEEDPKENQPASVDRRFLLGRTITQRREKTQTPFNLSLEKGGSN